MEANAAAPAERFIVLESERYELNPVSEPVIPDTSVVTNEDEAFDLSFTDLLSGLSSDFDQLTLQGVDETSDKGAVITLASGRFTYTPVPEQFGVAVDRFGYTVSNGVSTIAGDVFVSITPVNDPPVAVSDRFVFAGFSQPIILNPLDNDLDGGKRKR